LEQSDALEIDLFIARKTEILLFPVLSVFPMVQVVVSVGAFHDHWIPACAGMTIRVEIAGREVKMSSLPLDIHDKTR